MDYEWAEKVLRQHMLRIDACGKPGPKGERSAALKILNEGTGSVNGILRDLTPDHRQIAGTSLASHRAALADIRRAVGLIEVSLGVEPGAVNGDIPALRLDYLMYPVSDPAMPLWMAGKYRQAVADAATSVSRLAQERLGRFDVSEKSLMGEAFSTDDPKEGKPRLRCPGDHRTQAVRSQQHGALLIAQGCYEAIRNPAHHLTGDWNPVTAFEHLAVLSLVAGWIQGWNVAHAPAPPRSLPHRR